MSQSEGKPNKLELMERLRREGRWEAARRFKDEVIKASRARGMTGTAVTEHAWEETERNYPPLPPAEPQPSAAVDRSVTIGLPRQWKNLPERADAKEEIEWVHSQMFFIVRESPRTGKVRIDFRQVSYPPPSRGTLQLLEFAIQDRRGFNQLRFSLGGLGEGEEPIEKREKMTREEIRAVLGRYSAEREPGKSMRQGD